MSGVYAQAAAPGGKSSSSSSSSDSSKSSIWSSGLCSCMENCGICCMGLFCYPYQMIKVEKAVHGKDKDFECSDWCCCVCQCALYYGCVSPSFVSLFIHPLHRKEITASSPAWFGVLRCFCFCFCV
eukprot:TRINITY_DN1038_c0_g1_i1.p1 TRINITY_DN1038_c0_g1~~TRINITY_DN1038_c0_g1_i1.p1  ORF type:complete len:126 (-),score=15.61 TRINITY_DN1038_c0_g1_i1:38-415(-)